MVSLMTMALGFLLAALLLACLQIKHCPVARMHEVYMCEYTYLAAAGWAAHHIELVRSPAWKNA